MKKYGPFIVGCVAVAIMIICVLTSSAVARGPAWIEYTHALLGVVAIFVFAVVATKWWTEGLFDPPTPWQKYDEDAEIKEVILDLFNSTGNGLGEEQLIAFLPEIPEARLSRAVNALLKEKILVATREDFFELTSAAKQREAGEMRYASHHVA